MQLLKITTTPIKYRVEAERASFTLAESDTNIIAEKPQNYVKKSSGAHSATGNALKNATVAPDMVDQNGRIRHDKSFEHTVASAGTYDIKARYGTNIKTSRTVESGKMNFISQSTMSLDRGLSEMSSIVPDKSWEPEVNISGTSQNLENNSVDTSPKYEFNPATYKFIVEEYADVEIEYLGGFNYFPASSAPDYEEIENS